MLYLNYNDGDIKKREQARANQNEKRLRREREAAEALKKKEKVLRLLLERSRKKERKLRLIKIILEEYQSIKSLISAKILTQWLIASTSKKSFLQMAEKGMGKFKDGQIPHDNTSIGPDVEGRFPDPLSWNSMNAIDIPYKILWMESKHMTSSKDHVVTATISQRWRAWATTSLETSSFSWVERKNVRNVVLSA